MLRCKSSGRLAKDIMISANQGWQKYDLRRIRVLDFVSDMDLAYASADVVISGPVR